MLIDKEIFHANISLGAKAVYISIISLLDSNKDISITYLYSLSSDKKETTDNYIEELIDNGYIKIVEEDNKQYIIVSKKGDSYDYL